MNNEQYKVSIIVAVYNVEKYIRRCLDSLQKQTHNNIEVVLVDDGSKDCSGKICDEYACGDTRFKVIHQQNGGVSKARQAGLDAVTGDYVIHADPDDFVDSTEIEELLATAIETGADMVTCDFYLDGKYYKQEYKDEKELLARLVNVGIICVCWNVLVKRSFIIEHDVRFTPDWLNQSEDFLFISRLLVAGASAEHLNQAFYHYSSSIGDSLSNRNSRKKIDSVIAVIDEMEKIINPLDYDNLYTRKKYALHTFFNNRYFEKLNLYSDIHDRLLQEERHSPFAIALTGQYKKAYLFKVYLDYKNVLLRLKKNFIK